VEVRVYRIMHLKPDRSWDFETEQVIEPTRENVIRFFKDARRKYHITGHQFTISLAGATFYCARCKDGYYLERVDI
jgi:hypothetical protein